MTTLNLTTTNTSPPSTAPAKITPITCHVLDTLSGRPAASLPVTLTLIRPYGPSQPLTATTNSDGRVTAWSAASSGGPSLAELFANAAAHNKSEEGTGAGEMVWALRFDVGEYFKGEGFWTEVEVRFKTEVGGAEGREHWHVPLLLSPWSYTTYRGS